MRTHTVRLLLVGATCLALVSGCTGNGPEDPVPSPAGSSSAPPATVTSIPVPDTNTADIPVRDVIIDHPTSSTHVVFLDGKKRGTWNSW